MSTFYDTLETRSPAEREAALMAALPAQVAHAQRNTPAFAALLAGIDPASVTSREALARLPVTRKHELHARQQAARTAGHAQHSASAEDAFGGFAATGFGAGMPRVFCSPGPIYEPEGSRRDYWRMARALYAAGFRAGDLAHNCFSYHFVPAGAMMESGAHALGCTVFPGGTGQTEQQVQAMAELRPAGYIGTPSFLKLILERAAELKQPLPSLTKALLSAEAFPPSLRDWFAARGIAGYQCYGTADLGLIAYETEAREGLVLDEGVIVEIVRPGTGDLSAVLPGQCPTGRTNTRIRGWLGRADQTTKVRGMFVQPGQVAAIAARFPQVLRARLVVSGEMANDAMVLRVETTETSPALANRLQDTVREVTQLRAEIELVAPGTLPNDGLVIEDARSYR